MFERILLALRDIDLSRFLCDMGGDCCELLGKVAGIDCGDEGKFCDVGEGARGS